MLHIEPCPTDCATCAEPAAIRAVCKALKDAKDAVKADYRSSDVLLREHAIQTIRSLYSLCLINAIQAGTVVFDGNLAGLMRDVCASLETYLNQLPPTLQAQIRDATRTAEALRSQPRVTH